MKKSIITMLFFLFVLVLGACSSTGQQTNSTTDNADNSNGSKITMKLSHVSAPGSARDLASHKFKEVVEAETNGRVTVEIYPASQLGGQRDQVEGVQFGTIEMVVVPTAYLGGTQPLITLLDTPFFLPQNVDDLTNFYESEAVKKLLETTEETGIKSLGIWHTGYKQYTANKPLLSPDEFKGMKVRVMASPILLEEAKALGADGITMDFAETYSALQSGAIDGQTNPIDTIYDMKFHEVQSDITFTNHGTLDQLVMVNKNWFEGLDSEVQQAILKGHTEAAKVSIDKTYEAIDKYIGIIKEQGINLHELSEAQQAAFREAVISVHEFARTHFGDRGKELFEGLEAEVNKYK
jgi:C4-dicarboxylate-binding protein DctP